MRPPSAIFQVKIKASTFNSETQKKQKSRFFVIFCICNFFKALSHGRVILSYLSVTASKTLPRSEESTGTGRDVAIFGTPKKPKNGLKRIFRPQRRHFLPPCAVRAAARLPAAQRRLTVLPICPWEGQGKSNLGRSGPPSFSCKNLFCQESLDQPTFTF